jgi:catecholate siderophore receptor
VTKGSDGVMNGGGNGGGSINLSSRPPQARRRPRRCQLWQRRLQAHHRRHQPAAVRQWALRVAAMYHDQDIAGRNAVWQKRWGVAPSIKFGMNGRPA